MKSIFKSAALLLAAISISFGAQSCSSVKPIDKANLTGYWTLKSLNGEDAKVAFEGPIPSLEFDFEKSIVAGSAGCNRYTSPFTLTELNVFNAKTPAATLMMCIHKNKEGDFLKAIASPDLVLSIDKDGNLVFSQDNNAIMLFEKGEVPAETSNANGIVSAETLTGKWTLTSIAEGDIVKLFGDKVPTMEISADGKVFGNAGCNTYRTSYTQEENTITFAPLMSTKMACPNLEGESKFSKILSTPVQAGLNGDKLTFFQAGNIVLEFTKGTAE